MFFTNDPYYHIFDRGNKPSLIFAGKGEAYLRGTPSNFTRQCCYFRVTVADSDKHTSLLQCCVNYRIKRFYNNRPYLVWNNSCNRILYNFCLFDKKQIFQFIDPKTSFHNFLPKFEFFSLIISSLASDLLYCLMVCTDFQHCGTLYCVTTSERLFIQDIHLMLCDVISVVSDVIQLD